MSRRFTFPQVHELLPPRRDPRGPERPGSQRNLVAASLLLTGDSLRQRAV